jgi:hypothetical protein
VRSLRRHKDETDSQPNTWHREGSSRAEELEVSGKTSIYYVDLGGKPAKGVRVWVFVKEHHTLGIKGEGQWVHTSPIVTVVRDTKSGPVFETQNTIYVPHSTEGYVPNVPKFVEASS